MKWWSNIVMWWGYEVKKWSDDVMTWSSDVIRWRCDEVIKGWSDVIKWRSYMRLDVNARKKWFFETLKKHSSRIWPKFWFSIFSKWLKKDVFLKKLFSTVGFLGDVMAEKHTFFRPLTSSLMVGMSFLFALIWHVLHENPSAKGVRARNLGVKHFALGK